MSNLTINIITLKRNENEVRALLAEINLLQMAKVISFYL
jgi:hypothetical protein